MIDTERTTVYITTGIHKNATDLFAAVLSVTLGAFHWTTRRRKEVRKPGPKLASSQVNLRPNVPSLFLKWQIYKDETFTVITITQQSAFDNECNASIHQSEEL